MFSALIVFDFTNLKVKDYSFKTCWMLLIDVYSRLTQIIYFWKWTYSILIRKEFGASAAICGPFHNVPQGPQYAIFLINILLTHFFKSLISDAGNWYQKSSSVNLMFDDVGSLDLECLHNSSEIIYVSKSSIFHHQKTRFKLFFMC